MSLKTILKNFLNHVDSLEAQKKSGTDPYEIDFQKLKGLTEQLKHDKDYATSQGLQEVNRRKNRYKDILPYDYTRVVLSDYPGVPGSDYINANYIKGASGSLAYIASQGPLPNTVVDFWRMIWECEVQVVVMACNEQESGKYKCECYWPGDEEQKQYGNINVELVKWRQVCPDFLVRTLKACWEKEERVICQFHYTTWPDHGVPNSVQPILELVRLIRDCQASEAVPVLVHCSAGCGRTGTICAIDFVWGLMRMGKLTKSFNLFSVISDMRRQRIAMVQTKEQYVLVHKAVSSLFEQQLRVIDSHTYENLNEDGEPLIFKEMEEEEEGIYEDILECKPEDSFSNTLKDAGEKKTGFQDFPTESSIACIAEIAWPSQKRDAIEKSVDSLLSANKGLDSFLHCSADRSSLPENCFNSPFDTSNFDLKSSEKIASGLAEYDAEQAAVCYRNSKILQKLRQEEGVKRLITGWNKAVEQSDCCKKSEKCDQSISKSVTEKEMTSSEQSPAVSKYSKLKAPQKHEPFSGSEFMRDGPDALQCNERNTTGNETALWAMTETASFSAVHDSSEKRAVSINNKSVIIDDSHHPGKLVGKATVIRRPSIAKLKAFFEKSPADCDMPSEDTSRRRRPLFRSQSQYVGHSKTFSISDSLNQRTELSSSVCASSITDNVPESDSHFTSPSRVSETNREDMNKISAPSSHKEASRTSPLSSLGVSDSSSSKSFQGMVQDRTCAFRKNGDNIGLNRISSNHAAVVSGSNSSSGIMEIKYCNVPGSPTKKKSSKPFEETVGIVNALSENSESLMDEGKSNGRTANLEDEERKNWVENMKHVTPVQMRIKQFLPSGSDLEVPPDLPVKKKTAANSFCVQTTYEGDDISTRAPNKIIACNLNDVKTCFAKNYGHISKSISGFKKGDFKIPSNDKTDGHNVPRDSGNDPTKNTCSVNSCFKDENDHQISHTKNIVKKENSERDARIAKSSGKDKSKDCFNFGDCGFSANFSRPTSVNPMSTKMSPPVGKIAHNTEPMNTDETKYMNVNSLAQNNIQQIENKLKCHPRGAIIDLTSRKSYIDELQGSCDRQNAMQSANEPAVRLFQKVESYKIKSPEKTNFPQDGMTLIPKVDNSNQCKASLCSPNTKIPCLQGGKDSTSKREIQSSSSKSNSSGCAETVPKRVETSSNQQTSINLLLHSPPPKTKKTHSSKSGPVATSPASPKEPVYSDVLLQKSGKSTTGVSENRPREKISPPASTHSKIAVSNSQSPINSGSVTSRTDLRYFPVARQTVRNVKVVTGNSQKFEPGKVQNDFNHHQHHPSASETKADNHKSPDSYCADSFHETTEHSKIPQKAIPVSYDVHNQLSVNKSPHEKESTCNLQRSVSGPQIVHPASKGTVQDAKQPTDHYAVPHREGFSSPQNPQQIPESYNHPYYGKQFCSNDRHGLQVSPFPPGPPKPPRTYYYDYRNAQERGGASRDIYGTVQSSGSKDRGRYLVSVASPKHSVPKSSQQMTEARTPDFRCYPNTVLKPADRRHNIYYSPQIHEPGSFSSVRSEIYMSHSYPSAAYCDSRQALQPTRNQYYSETLSHSNVRLDPGVHTSVSVCRSDSEDEKIRSGNRSFSSNNKNRCTFSDYENVYDAQNDYLCAVANNIVEDDPKHSRSTNHALQCSQSDVSVYAALHFQKPNFPASVSQTPYNIPESTNVGTLSRRPIFDTLQRRNKLQVSWEQRRSHDDMDIRPAPSARLKEQIHARRSMVELDNLGISVAADKGSPEEDLLPHLISPKHEFAQEAVGDFNGRSCLPGQKVKIPVEMADTLFSKVPDVPQRRCHTHSKEAGSFGGTLSKAFGKLTSLTKFSAKDSSVSQFSSDCNSNATKGVTTKTKEKDKANCSFPHRSPKKSKDSRDPQEQWTQV